MLCSCDAVLCHAHTVCTLHQQANRETYRSVLTKVDMGEMSLTVQKVEGLLARAQSYVDTWLQYQALWDMTPEQVGDGAHRIRICVLAFRMLRRLYQSLTVALAALCVSCRWCN